jgi:hypothetical protein
MLPEELLKHNLWLLTIIRRNVSFVTVAPRLFTISLRPAAAIHATSFDLRFQSVNTACGRFVAGFFDSVKIYLKA